MRNEAFWRREIDRLNRTAILRAQIPLQREFAKLSAEVLADRAGHRVALRRHALRLTALLAAHGRVTAQEFAVLTARMIGPALARDGAKADDLAPQTEAARQKRVGEVLRALAMTIAAGAWAESIAAELARNAMTVAAVEAAITTAPTASAAQIAATLLENRAVAARLALAAANSVAAEAVDAATEQTPASGQISPNAGASGGDRPPPPPKPPSGGARPPKRSRFSELVERIVREEAPVRARRIAATSGRAIAQVLVRAAAEGWGEQRTAKALREALGDEVALFHARRIARTEMGGGQNGATFALALDREAAGEDLEKSWVTTIDGRERSSHRDLNRETRPLQARFSNGLMHPHEFGAPAGEVINCRCGLLIYRRQSAPIRDEGTLGP